jgi:hypothetical protein
MQYMNERNNESSPYNVNDIQESYEDEHSGEESDRSED